MAVSNEEIVRRGYWPRMTILEVTTIDEKKLVGYYRGCDTEFLHIQTFPDPKTLDCQEVARLEVTNKILFSHIASLRAVSYNELLEAVQAFLKSR